LLARSAITLLSWSAIVALTVAVTSATTTSLGFVETRETILTNDFSEVSSFFHFFFNQEFIDVFDKNALLIFFQDLLYGIYAQREWRFSGLTVVDEKHHALKNIGLEMGCSSFWKLQSCIHGWEITRGLYILIEFEIQAALQFATLTGQFGRIERQLLITSCTGAYCAEIGEPTRATQFTSAATDASQAARFIAVADLSHINAHTEFFCVFLD
jgi:hypothetical protein